jgi:phosphatidylglycerol:prolipoprotein diacylglycerol transferase
MLHYPHFDPVAFKLGPIAVHWYGLMYLLSFCIGWLLGVYRAKKTHSGWRTEMITDLLFYVAVGVIVGGRVGYMILYDLPGFFQHPLTLFTVWDGGMSFHGGFIGVMCAVGLFCRKHKKSFFTVMDFIAPIVPIGLAAGRLGNFINGELWGRVTTMPWGMIYPDGGPLPRHPSELYELLLEGVVLFIVLWCYSMKPRPKMAVSAVFLIGYGCARIFCEFFRVPDPQYGYLLWHWLTVGQLYSLPMLIVGISMLWFAYHKQRQKIRG